jgi:hypothetical protein
LSRELSPGRAAALAIDDSCRRDVVAQLVELQRSADSYLRRDGIAAEDEQFCAEQNARVVAGVEECYRAMFEAPSSSWNLRDRHMADTLDRLGAHLARHGTPPKIVVFGSSTCPPPMPPRHFPAHAWSGRSASFAGRRPSARAITSWPTWQTSSTR